MIAVANAGFRAIAPDFRGYGLSEQPAEPAKTTFKDLIDDLLVMLDLLNIPKVCYAQGNKRGESNLTKIQVAHEKLGSFYRFYWWEKTSELGLHTISPSSTLNEWLQLRH